jgi:hypothetical protein
MNVLPICKNQHITQDKPFKIQLIILDGSCFESVYKTKQEKVIFDDIQYKFNTMIAKRKTE